MEPKIYKPIIYKGAGIYKTGSEGGGQILDGTTPPDNAQGQNGDIYIYYTIDPNVKTIIPIQSNNNNCVWSDQWTSDGGNAWHLFDGNNGTYWSTNLNNNTNQFCGFKFDAAKTIKTFSLFPRVFGGSPQIKNFIFQGSNDGIVYDDLYSDQIPDVTPARIYNYAINNNTPYLYYRLFVLNTWGSQTITLLEMSMSESPTIETKEPIDVYRKINGVWTSVL